MRRLALFISLIIAIQPVAALFMISPCGPAVCEPSVACGMGCGGCIETTTDGCCCTGRRDDAPDRSPVPSRPADDTARVLTSALAHPVRAFENEPDQASAPFSARPNVLACSDLTHHERLALLCTLRT